MAFQVSPGVLVQEKDLTNVIPAVATSIGAIAGDFVKGPLDEVVTVSSESDLVETFGKPNSTTFESFFSATSFLQYGQALKVVRVSGTGILNATANGSGLLINNTTSYQNDYSGGAGSVGLWAARTAGAWGNNLKISICPSSTAYEETSKTTVNNTNLAVGDTTVTVASSTGIIVGDIVNFGESGGYEYRVTAVSSNDLTIVRHPSGVGGLHTAVANGSAVRRRWQYYDLVSAAPGTSPYVSDRGGSGDELHVVVVDEDGDISGKAGEVLEVYDSVSKASDAKTPQGDTNYYPDVIYNKSTNIYWMDHHSSGSNWGDAALNKTFTAVTTVKNDSLRGGADGSAATTAQKKTAYEKFDDAETVDISLIIAGNGDSTHVDNLITIAENRKDAVVFASPERADVVNNNSYDGKQRDDIISFRDALPSSSYAVIDSGWKYQYDKYNDLYRYVPLNGDTAGLMVQTDSTRDPWYSPAGYNRGNVKNCIKLAYNPSKSDRDQLYKKGINPVVTFPGQGTVLFGDKTMLAQPSAFDRINVRRLFIVLEKAISTASKFTLFEFNDEFTRSQFRNLVEPFLRDVQGRRGIIDYRVVCDTSNNTGEVIDRNEFVGDIYIKPARSINFIQLNFVAVRSGVEFSEVVGQFG